MSASLVGSEMCIRDSPTPPALSHRPRGPRQCITSLVPFQTVRVARGVGCLLYTSDAADDM
eukprot:5909784-Alexandrium_andersonii.AAC.1